MKDRQVLISEVGPRDGLQAITTMMASDDKRQWVDALFIAGIREIEVGSFVPKTTLPQMADTEQLVRHALRLEGLTVVTLVPNVRGALDAIRSGSHKMTIPVSASLAHSMANVRRTPEQMVEEVGKIVRVRNAEAPHVGVEVGISTAFGCNIQGFVPEDDVLRLAQQVVDAGADECGLSDTAGYANPAQVHRMFTRLHIELGDKAGAAHLHNTYGLGLANCLAAYDAGVRTFDASLAGLGGCPYAPGASGNVITEDLVFMFEAMGIETGINVGKLLSAREVLEQSLPDEPLYGMVGAAGIPKIFEQRTKYG
jgi:hydroxymethylglutaryl-CoA lyase